MRIIAFGHRSRVGKDTAARFAFDYIKSNHPKIKVVKASFFNPIKDMIAELYSWSGLQGAMYYENHQPEKDQVLSTIGKTPRDIWLQFGKALSTICPQTVPEYALGLIPANTDLVVLSDLRRIIEAKTIRKFTGSQLIRIINDDAPELDNALDAELDFFNDWDCSIENSGTLKDFNIQISNYLERNIFNA